MGIEQKRYQGSTYMDSLTRSGRHGFAFIELILVVIVIAILSGLYFNNGGGGAQQAASTYQQSMDRSKATACLASRSAMRSVIMTYTMQNPGKPVTAEALKASGVNLNVCPEGGVITVAADGTLECSIHKP
jgi:prepilin-type N-terminal cleavage/methylation domain-containing protein